MPMMLALLSLALQATAEPPTTTSLMDAVPDWRSLGSARDGTIDWDMTSVRRGETVIVTTRFTPSESPQRPYAYLISQVELRCAPPEAHVVETVNYRADGSVAGADTDPEPFVAIPDGSLFATLHRLVC